MQPAQAVQSDDGTWKVIIIEQAIDEPDAVAMAEAYNAGDVYLAHDVVFTPE